MSVDLVRTLSKQLTYEQSSVASLDRYYAGQQPIGYLHPQVRAATAGRLQSLSVNWCRVVVGAVEERLDVEGFRIAGEDAAIPELWRVWQANGLDEFSGLAHVDALVHGRAFALVWYGDDEKTPRVTVESAREMTVTYAPGSSVITAALKEYVDADRRRFSTLYLPDRIEQYVTDSNGTRELTPPIEHDLGAVPVVSFVNQPRLGLTTGESELSDVMPLVDAINKCGTDLLVSAEYHAMPRRWATGMQLQANAGGEVDERTRELVKQKWQEAEAGRTWLAGPGVQFGQFNEASLDNFISAIRMFTEQIAAIAKLPPHMLGVSTANPASADAIRSAEAGLVQKVRRKQRAFGGAWENVMRLVARMMPGEQAGDLALLETVWRDPQTPTIAQAADAAVKLKQAGIISDDLALEGLGYTPVQIDTERRRRADALLGPVRAQLDEAARLMETGLSQQAAFAAVGLLQAASAIGPKTA